MSAPRQRAPRALAILAPLASAALLACGPREAPPEEHVSAATPEPVVTSPAPAASPPLHERALQNRPATAAELRHRPPPPSPRALADQVEWLLLLHAGGDPDALALALQRVEVLARQHAAYHFGTFLYAHALRLDGDREAAARLIDSMEADVAAVYGYLFEGPPDEVTALLRCHLLKVCLRRASGGAPPRPAAGPFDLVGHDALPDGEPASCGGMTVDPDTCPDRFAVFERAASEHFSGDRLQRWRNDHRPMSPEDLAGRLGIEPGRRVADVGAGMGYFSIPFARVVGPEGRVYAVEIDEALVAFLDAMAEDLGQPQLRAVLSRPEDVTLPPGSVDVAFLCAVIKDLLMEDRARRAAGRHGVTAGFLSSIHRALVPGGALVIIDHAATEDDPDPQVISIDDLTGIVRSACFEPRDELDDFLPTYHVLRFTRGDCGPRGSSATGHAGE